MTRRTDRGISGGAARRSWVETRPGLLDSILVAVCVGIAAGAVAALVTGVDGVAVAPTVAAVLGVLVTLRRSAAVATRTTAQRPSRRGAADAATASRSPGGSAT